MKSAIRKFVQGETKARYYIYMLFYSAITLPFFFGKISSGLDPSWRFFLNKLSEFGKYKFGKDFVFTYGFLGFLANPMDLGGNVLFSIILYGILFVGQVYVAYCLMIKRKISDVRIIVFLLWIFLAPPTHSSDLFIEYCTLFALLLILKEPNNMVGLVYFEISFLIAFFYKFSTAIPLIASLLIYSIIQVCNRQLKQIWIVVITLILVICACMLYNPSFADFETFIVGSWEVSQGFNISMSSDMYDETVYGVLLLALLFMIFMLIQLLSQRWNMLYGMLIVSPELFMGYKHGYVRADGHIILGFVEMMCLVSLVVLFYESDAKLQSQKKAKLIYIFEKGVFLSFCVLMLFFYRDKDLHPYDMVKDKYRDIYHIVSKQVDFTEIDDSINSVIGEKLLNEIGNNSFSSYPWEISFIESMGEKANNFVPLPCFQMYSAYTPFLDQFTSELFMTDGPQYLIINMDTIDGRIPFLEAPYTWNAISRNYRFCMKDDNCILLKKYDNEDEDDLVLLGKHVCDKNEIINVNDCECISIDMELSLWGRIVSLFWKIPTVEAVIEYTDGTVHMGRVIVPNLKNGIYTKKLPYNMEMLKSLTLGNEISEVSSIAFYGNGLKYYKSEICCEMMN